MVSLSIFPLQKVATRYKNTGKLRFFSPVSPNITYQGDCYRFRLIGGPSHTSDLSIRRVGATAVVRLSIFQLQKVGTRYTNSGKLRFFGPVSPNITSQGDCYRFRLIGGPSHTSDLSIRRVWATAVVRLSTFLLQKVATRYKNTGKMSFFGPASPNITSKGDCYRFRLIGEPSHASK